MATSSSSTFTLLTKTPKPPSQTHQTHLHCSPIVPFSISKSISPLSSNPPSSPPLPSLPSSFPDAPLPLPLPVPLTRCCHSRPSPFTTDPFIPFPNRLQHKSHNFPKAIEIIDSLISLEIPNTPDLLLLKSYLLL